jgi:hypothetical protein
MAEENTTSGQGTHDPVRSSARFRSRWTPNIGPIKSSFGFQGLNYGP